MDSVFEFNLDTENDAQKVMDYLKTYTPSSCKILADLMEAEDSILYSYDNILSIIDKLPPEYNEQFKKGLGKYNTGGSDALQSAHDGIEKLDYDITKLINMLDPDGTCVFASSSSDSPKTIRLESFKDADKRGKEYVRDVLIRLSVYM